MSNYEQRKNYRFEFGFKSRRETIIRTQLETEQADQIVDLIYRSFHQDLGGILKIPQGKSQIHFIRLSEVESVVYEVGEISLFTILWNIFIPIYNELKRSLTKWVNQKEAR